MAFPLMIATVYRDGLLWPQILTPKIIRHLVVKKFSITPLSGEVAHRDALAIDPRYGTLKVACFYELALMPLESPLR